MVSSTYPIPKDLYPFLTFFSFNHGQTCCAGTRVYVQAGIYDEFQKKFLEKVKQIQLGDPLKKGVTQGPQVSQQQFDVRPLRISCIPCD